MTTPSSTDQKPSETADATFQGELAAAVQDMPEDAGPKWFRDRIARIARSADQVRAASRAEVAEMQSRLTAAEAAPAALTTERDTLSARIAELEGYQWRIDNGLMSQVDLMLATNPGMDRTTAVGELTRIAAEEDLLRTIAAAHAEVRRPPPPEPTTPAAPVPPTERTTP